MASSICSRCGSARDIPTQAYCRPCRAAYTREHRTPYRDLPEVERAKQRTRSLAGYYQSRGRLKPEPCERCLAVIGVEKHHADYTKPLEVRWLCRRCHAAEHDGIDAVRKVAQQLLGHP